MGLFSRLGALKASFPAVEVVVPRLHFWKSFCSPKPYVFASIVNAESAAVGKVWFGILPIFDRIYLFYIEIFSEHWGRNYATAAMAHLVDKYRMPVMPVKPSNASLAYWNKLRKSPRRDAYAGLCSQGVLRVAT